MPMYTSYRVKGVVRPCYVKYVEKFLKEYQWDEEEAPDGLVKVIKEWHAFQRQHDSFKVIDGKAFYANRIPLGLPSPWWGAECVMYEAYDILSATEQEHTVPPHILSISGELINKHHMIEFFMTNVMSELCSSIILCWTCDEDATMFTEHKEVDIRANKWCHQ